MRRAESSHHLRLLAPEQEASHEPTDFLTLKRFIAPFLIQIVYWIGLGVLVLGALGSLFAGGFLGVAIGLVSLVLGALVWRVVCEIWIVIFSINDRLGIIANK